MDGEGVQSSRWKVVPHPAVVAHIGGGIAKQLPKEELLCRFEGQTGEPKSANSKYATTKKTSMGRAKGAPKITPRLYQLCSCCSGGDVAELPA